MVIELFPNAAWSWEDQVPHSRRIWASFPPAFVTLTDHSIALRYLGNRLTKKICKIKQGHRCVKFSKNKHRPAEQISTVGTEDAAVNVSLATFYFVSRERSVFCKVVAIDTTLLRVPIFLQEVIFFTFFFNFFFYFPWPLISLQCCSAAGRWGTGFAGRRWGAKRVRGPDAEHQAGAFLASVEIKKQQQQLAD